MRVNESHDTGKFQPTRLLLSWCNQDHAAGRVGRCRPSPTHGGPVNLKEQLDALLDATAFDSTGTKVGAVRQVYVDDASGKITFATVSTGIFSADAIVPLHGARLLDRELHVDHTRAVIRDSPRPDDTEDGLSPEQEIKLLEYYGIEAQTRRRGDAATPAPTQKSPTSKPEKKDAKNDGKNDDTGGAKKGESTGGTPAARGSASRDATSGGAPTERRETPSTSGTTASAPKDAAGTTAPRTGAGTASPKGDTDSAAPKEGAGTTAPKDGAGTTAPKGKDGKDSTTTTSPSTPAGPTDSPSRPPAGTPGNSGARTPTTSKNGGSTSASTDD
ncbi:hypothetical protein NCCP2495_19640 [Dietzia sp. NCCP-2495]|nr:hypothetical protein NCCP2495_19640 [Dietzia sp. NCCP-2495]